MKMEPSQILAWCSFAILVIGGLIRMGRQLEQILNLLQEQKETLVKHEETRADHEKRIQRIEWRLDAQK